MTAQLVARQELPNPRHLRIPNADEIDAVMAYAVATQLAGGDWLGFLPGCPRDTREASSTAVFERLRSLVVGRFAQCLLAIKRYEEGRV